MALGLVGAGGASGGAAAIKMLRDELLKRRMLAEQLQQQEFENERALTAEDLTRGKMSEDSRQFDASLGLNRDKFGLEQQQYTEGAPMRAANLRQVGLQSDKLAREPQDVEAERAFMREMQGTKTQDELGLIGARTRGQLRVAAATPRQGRLVQVMGPNGVPIWTPEEQAAGQPAANVPRQPTGADRKAVGFFNRMLEAERNARKVEGKTGSWDAAITGSILPDMLENALQTGDGQLYAQAMKAFTEARLRQESGAAIANTEYDNDRTTNFRQPSDTPENLKQKRGSRLTTLRGLGNASGRALQEFYGEGATLDDLLKEFADEQPAGSGEYDFVPGKGLVKRGS
jgi:hypothetical protein